MALYLDGQKIISGGGGSGGHTIVDSEGTSLEQRTNLQFNGTYSEDNATDDATEINIVREMTKAEFDELTEEEKTGLINITDVTANADDKFQPLIYSAEEREVGVWTNGKPLYQKTIISTSELSRGAINQISLGITDIDVCVSVSGFSSYGSNNTYVPLPYGDKDNSLVCLMNINRASSIANVWVGSDYSSPSTVNILIITLRYTKTTDTPGSGTWTPQGVPAIHYSTDEHIVGTWTDGSILYEKTYSISSLSSSSVLIDSNITSETAKIRSTSYGSYRLSGAGYDAQYVSHTSYSIFARLVFNPSGLYANIENITSGVTASDFDITVRYTKSST